MLENKPTFYKFKLHSIALLCMAEREKGICAEGRERPTTTALLCRERERGTRTTIETEDHLERERER